LVRARVRWIMCARFGLRVPPRCIAIRSRRGHLGGRGFAPRWQIELQTSLARGATHFGHIVVVKKLGLTVVPIDLHAGPIGSDVRAPIGRAVMPRHAVADFQSFGLVAGMTRY
jgi:hypothetical protein